MKGKEKEKIISSQIVLESVRLGHLIAETEQLLDAKQTALLHLPARHTALLGEAEVDLQQVAQVKAETGGLQLNVEDLTTRLRLLETQKWNAEKIEAADRVREIVTECERLVGAAAQAQAILDEAERAVLESLRAVVSVYGRHLELVREKTHLTASYRLGLVAVPVLPELDPCPTLAVQLGEAMQPLLNLRLRAPLPKRQPPKSESVFAEP
jgi:hypothetical protein